jgi:hypothetical protein
MGKELKDIGRLRPPIHSRFANWGSSPREVERFTKLFGVLWGCDSDVDFSFEVSAWVKDQKKFRKWWWYQLGPKPALKLSPRGAEIKKLEEEARRIQRATMGQPPIEEAGDQRSYFDDLKGILEYSEPSSGEYRWPIPGDPIPSLVLTAINKGINVEIAAPNLWIYMILRLLREKPAMLRICENSTCPNKYFIATRKDQKFCDSRCSQLVASRRWYESRGRDRRRERSLSRTKKGKR